MSQKSIKIIYWIATAMLCGLFLFSAFMYFTKYDMVTGFFETLGYPTYIVYPRATIKVLGVIAILTKLSDTMKEWAYFGFLLDLILASAAHYHAGHPIGCRYLEWRHGWCLIFSIDVCTSSS